MINYARIILNVLKASLRSKIKAILNGRYFPAVEFFNKKNISVDKSSAIEQGSRILVIQPVREEINVCIGEKCWIGRDVEIQTNYDSKIVIKKNVSIQDRCKVLGSVYIGQDSLLAPDVFLSSGSHYYNYQPELPIKQQDKLAVGSAEGFSRENDPIVIEEDCWLGKNTVVMKGVNIGRGAILASNSFVNKDVFPYEVWAGSPAKCVKKRYNFIPPLNIIAAKMEDRPYFYRGFEHMDAYDDEFLSGNTSVCVLEISDRISLILSGKIYTEGLLKIWSNGDLIFDSIVNPGNFNKNLILTATIASKAKSDLYQSLPVAIKKFRCIVFEFERKQQTEGKGLSIIKIEQHD